MSFMKLEPAHLPDLSYHSRGQLAKSSLRSLSSSSDSSSSSSSFEFDPSTWIGPFQLRDTSPPSSSGLYWGLHYSRADLGPKLLNAVPNFRVSQEQSPDPRSSRNLSSSSFEVAPGVCGTPLTFQYDCLNPKSEVQSLPCLSAQVQGQLPIEDPQTPYCYESSPQAQPKADLMASMADNNTHNYGWQSRPSHPLHPSSMAMEQQPFSQPQTLPASSGYPIGYHPPQTTTQGFYQPGIPAPQYLCSPHPGLLQSRHPRSSSIPYSFPSSHVPGSPPTIAEQPFGSSPPSYLLNHQEYYYSQAPSLSSNQSSLAVSPQSQHIMTPGTVYSSPDTAPTSSDPEQQVRVISFRPKPQCWDHGCNGREFSTFSNLLRHQREKSGVVAKAECPSCGAVFTRTTARNIHVSQGKCKGSGRETSSE